MSKLSFSDRSPAQASALFSMKEPTLPDLQKQPAMEKRIADPSSTQPKGCSYPMPSFFEYRANPKEYDSL